MSFSWPSDSLGEDLASEALQPLPSKLVPYRIGQRAANRVLNADCPRHLTTARVLDGCLNLFDVLLRWNVLANRWPDNIIAPKQDECESKEGDSWNAKQYFWWFGLGRRPRDAGVCDVSVSTYSH